MAYVHPQDAKEALTRKVALAIWSAHATPMRLLDEITRPGTNLDKQQSLCWKQARAVVAALS